MKGQKLEDKDRFGFGENWKNFLNHFDQERLNEAKDTLITYLKLKDLKDKTFLDIGSGSGLFSLAAYELGANVVSFDYDINSVACTKYLKEKHTNNSSRWQVVQGSVLDENFLSSLGKFDIVYSWGVLHHTGNMHNAFENVTELVNEKGYLFISIYNDQGRPSKRWKAIKKLYNQSGIIIKSILTIYTFLRLWSMTITKDFLGSGNPFKSWNEYGKNRGMSAYYDLIDWVGGYPFEVAKPEEVFNFFRDRGFKLIHLKTCAAGLGCNEFVFNKQ